MRTERPSTNRPASSRSPNSRSGHEAGRLRRRRTENRLTGRRCGIICHELSAHMPFTALGTLTGLAVLGLLLWTHAPRSLSVALFWTLHPVHVLLSALVTTAMFRRHGGAGVWRILAIGYLGSVGIATLSDSILPYAGEWLLDLPHRGLHLGFIEKWWLVNPLALAGIVAGLLWPHTKVPHAGHVLLSTWASLFHITMATAGGVGPVDAVLIALFLFLSVWLPCCTSDIVFPLVFAPREAADPRPAGSAGARSPADSPTPVNQADRPAA